MKPVANNEKKTSKGFAGLEDLVSVVEAKPPMSTAPLRPAAQATHPTSSWPSPIVPKAPGVEPIEPRRLAQKSSGLSVGWIFAICVGGIIVIASVFGGGSNSNTDTAPEQVYVPTTPAYPISPPLEPVYDSEDDSEESTYTPTAPVYDNEPTFTPTAPVYESPPPVQTYESQPMPGTDNVRDVSE